MNERPFTELDESQARQYFLSSSSFSDVVWPEYFDFGPLLQKVAEGIPENVVIGSIAKKANGISLTNHVVYSSKAHGYGWRPLTLINPVSYVSLVNELTEKGAWSELKERYCRLSEESSVECCSVIALPRAEERQVESNIRGFWSKYELRALSLASQYEVAAVTDISVCYDSVYTHSIAWAVHDKEVAKENKFDFTLLGNRIDKVLQAMNYGQTNGVAQGTTVSHFLAELLLKYIDRELSRRLNQCDALRSQEYEILRYRDDYKIFAHSAQTASVILASLSEVLKDVGMRLNDTKTVIYEDGIEACLKSDKRALLESGLLNKVSAFRLLGELEAIRLFSSRYPSSGSVRRLLSEFRVRLASKGISLKNDGKLDALIGLVVDILKRNPGAVAECFNLLSVLLGFKPDRRDRSNVLKSLFAWSNGQANTGLFQVWMQRISAPLDLQHGYGEKLVLNCPKRNLGREMWGCKPFIETGLKDLTDTVRAYPIVNEEMFRSMNAVMHSSETVLFQGWEYGV